MAKLPSGLQINPFLTSAQAPALQFEPSLGIMARRVDKLGLDIRSFREPLKRAIQHVMIPSFAMNFHKYGRPNRWEPLSEETIRKRGGQARILDDTGKLKNVMAQLSIWTLGVDKAFIADLPQSVWYGKVQQMGTAGDKKISIKNVTTGRIETHTVAGEGGIPARPFVVMQDQDIDSIELVFSEWLAERVARNKFLSTKAVL